MSKRKYEDNKHRDKRNKHSYDELNEKEDKLSKLIFGDSEGFASSLSRKFKDRESASTSYKSRDDDSDDDRRKLAPAWEDEDEAVTVEKAFKRRQRHVPDDNFPSKSEKYSKYLKQKYANIVTTPKWAELKDDSKSKDDILQSCGFLDKSKDDNLSSSHISIKKLNNINEETRTEGPFVNSVEFHPTATVALVVGSGGIFSLFAVDGKNNNKLHSVKFENFPIYNGKLSIAGDEAIFGSVKHSYINVYNLIKTESTRVYLPSDMVHMKRFALSTDGKYIAAAGRFGEIHLLDYKTKEQVASMKQDTSVRALAFTPDCKQLFCHSDMGEVAIFDLRTHKMMQRWCDEGCIQGSTIDISPSGQYVATGSYEGVANMYDINSVTEPTSTVLLTPKPVKAFLNLRTSISLLKFNPSSEILAFGSCLKEGAVRLAHVGTQKVFTNFPGTYMKTCKPISIGFSPLSGYVGIGNNKFQASLYRLKHYSNY